MISAVARDPWYPLSLGPIGTVVQHLGDDLEPARIAEAADDERRVAADMSVLVRQPADQRRDDAGVVTLDDLLGNHELLREDLLALESLHQRFGREWLSTVDLRGARGATKTTTS